MDYSGEGAGVYAEAKGEYTKQLCQYLTPALQKFFLNLLDTAKEREPDPKKLLLSFQILLEGISEWNNDKLQRETQNLAMSTQCDYLEELLTAVFVAHTKVLSSIRLTNKQRKLQITIPKLEHFLHKTLIECARLLWTNTFLFSTMGTSMERQKNMRQIEALIIDGILQGIRAMLPVKSILREYLSNDDTDTEAEDDDEDDDEEDEEDEEEKEEEVGPKPDTTVPVSDSGPTANPVVDFAPTISEASGPATPAEPTGPAPIIFEAPRPAQPVKITEVSRRDSITEFDPSKYDVSTDFVSVSKLAESAKPSEQTLKSPVEQQLQDIPTIHLEEPAHVKFSNVDTVFSDTVINESGYDNKNQLISDEIDTDIFEFEEL